MGFLDNMRGVLRREAAPPAEMAEPTVEEPPAPPPSRTHTVRSGEALGDIAQRYGVDYLEIARLNAIDNPDLIFPGQVFKIPAG